MTTLTTLSSWHSRAMMTYNLHAHAININDAHDEASNNGVKRHWRPHLAITYLT